MKRLKEPRGVGNRMATVTPVTLDSLAKDIKALRKDIRKIRQHIEDPSGEKAKARAQNNGFNKLLDVTPELRAFLNLAADEKISRAQVTSRINTYVTEKELKAGQNITLDEPLQKLLNPPAGTQVTFLNIQKYINPHYLKDPNAPEKKPRAVKKALEPALEGAAEAAAAPPKEKKVRPKVAKPATTA
jgi:chromatin remodeling complex protein RSC6